MRKMKAPATDAPTMVCERDRRQKQGSEAILKESVGVPIPAKKEIAREELVARLLPWRWWLIGSPLFTPDISCSPRIYLYIHDAHFSLVIQCSVLYIFHNSRISIPSLLLTSRQSSRISPASQCCFKARDSRSAQTWRATQCMSVRLPANTLSVWQK